MKRILVCGFIALVCFASAATAQLAPTADYGYDPALTEISSVELAAGDRFQAQFPGAMFYREGTLLTRVYGRVFGTGDTPQQAAERFLAENADLFGAETADLVPFTPVLASGNALPLMYDPEQGTYKFTLLYYSQYRGGLPVFRADVRVLVRNEPGYPLVWAGSSLRRLGAFRPDLANIAAVDPTQVAPQMINFTPPQQVIWAGLNEQQAQPVLAWTFEADNYGSPTANQPEKWLYVVDAATGSVLYQENLIISTDVTGQVHGMATTLNKSAECNPEVDTVMPYAKVAIGATTVYADVNGNFTIPNPGTSAVTVTSYMSGYRFNVIEKSGTLETLSMSVTPPGPANFMHNSANTDERIRAQTNAYVEANRVRNWALTYLPTYPTISGQTNFTLNVNYALTCNAYYDGSSLNFYLTGGGCSNTAFSSVVHHEYGHHMVATGGSGQGEYGEGMSDTVAALIANDPVLGYGFELNCSAGIRTADNTCQYLSSGCSSCGSAIHACGQLLSGIVWDIRTNLMATEPANYLNIISSLTVNSITVHSGTGINAQIAIDFLTLDDDDGNISNGTPHRTEICNAFTAHGISCPALATGMSVSPTGGLASGGPAGGPFTPSAINYTVQNLGTTSINYTVAKTQNWVTLSSTGGSLAGGASTTVLVSLNSNATSLPNGAYSDTVTFTNTTTGQGNTTRPVSLGVGVPTAAYSWNMDTNPNWTISGGQWAWGQPTGSYGDPTGGHTGTNVYGYNLSGRYANNIPEYNLTTTAINCANLSLVSLKFWRWLGVEDGQYDHAYIRVSNDNTNWTTIWQNPAGSGDLIDTAWSQQSYDISAVADNHATVYVRWVMGTTDSLVRYCGWNIDDVEIWGVTGTPSDTTPPTPNPMTFAVAPAPASTASISMTATTATDPTPTINYNFNCVTDTTDSGWQTSTAYTDSGLTANTAYSYRVKARDGASPTPNETAYSTPAASTATLIQTPTGVSFGTVTSNSIVLNADGTFTNLNVGFSGLYFDSTTTGGDGGINAWVTTPTDTATGLLPDTSYTFQAKARNQNSVETAYTSMAAKATLANVPAAPTLANPTSSTMTLDVNANGNPTWTVFAIQCTATSPNDAAWLNKYVNAAGASSASAVWQTELVWANIAVNGLQPATTYTFAVKARNQENVETAFGPVASLPTLPLPTGACCYHDGTCAVTQQAACTGTWTIGGTCAPNLCLQPDGSCCYDDGTCAVTKQAACTGTWTIDGTCVPNLCLQPTGACCYAAAPCALVTQTICTNGGGAYQGNSTPCTPHPCCLVLGDMNGDTYVNGADIQGFVDAMLAGFAPCADLAAPYDVLDMNDVSAFVSLLLGS